LISQGHDISGDIPLFIVNEPMFIASGQNSHIRYNEYYPKWVYDEYRLKMTNLAKKHGWRYADLWNAIPANLFTDTPLHPSAEGTVRLAQLLIPNIKQIICP
jgi:hypothetical protein